MLPSSNSLQESLQHLADIYEKGLFCIDISEGSVSKPYPSGIFSSCWRFIKRSSGSDVSNLEKLIDRVYISYALETQDHSHLLDKALKGMKWLKTHYTFKGRHEIKDILERIISKGERVLEQILIIEKEDILLFNKEKDLPLSDFFYYQKKLEFFLKINSLEPNEIEFLKNCQIALNLGMTLINKENQESFWKKDSFEILKESLKSSKFGLLLPLGCQDRSFEMNQVIPIGIRQTEKGLFLTYYNVEISKEDSFSYLLSLMQQTLFATPQKQTRVTYGPYSHEEIIDLLHLHYFLFKKRLTAHNKEEALKHFEKLFDLSKRLPISALETLSFKNNSSRSGILDWLLDTCQRNGKLFELLNALHQFGEMHEETFQASEKGLPPEEILSLREKNLKNISEHLEDLEKDSDDSEDIISENFIDISLPKKTKSFLV